MFFGISCFLNVYKGGERERAQWGEVKDKAHLTVVIISSSFYEILNAMSLSFPVSFVLLFYLLFNFLTILSFCCNRKGIK